MTTQSPRSHLTRTSIPRTPITAYAYCGDCGADAGSPCVDEDLKPCSMCPGRVLASSGSLAAREARNKYKRKAREVKAPACVWCGAPPTGTAHGRAWCGGDDCRRAIKADYDRRYRANGRTMPPPKPGPNRKSRAKPGPPSTCTVCGVVVQRGGRWCKAHQTERLQDLYARRMAKTVPCWWCGDPAPDSQSCGEPACERARRREWKQAEKAEMVAQ